MLPIQLQPDQVEFIILSFEGPDPYAQAGGLGVRVANLSHALAAQGFRTHLLFVGDPYLPGYEDHLDGCLQLHRWCQWISRFHPLGVYDGEEAKLTDFSASVPQFVLNQIARPAIEQGRCLVVLAEEWHTAGTLIQLSDALHAAGLRDRAVLLWNANNTMGFERIDWSRLNFVATLTTVSRYMKQIMRFYGLDPLIIPNGIPAHLLQPPPRAAVEQVRAALASFGELLLFKVGRFDPSKCWWMAVETVAYLKQSGETVRFLCRGGIEPHGIEVLNHAREMGLVVRDVDGRPATWSEALELIQAAGPADLYNLRFHMSQIMLQVFYAAADFVLANSKHEPFGLVGLEAMAAGGVVFTGPTGETYSADGDGAIALDTESAEEPVLIIQKLRQEPERALAVRRAAPRVAAHYTWDNVLTILFEKIRLASAQQKTLTPGNASSSSGLGGRALPAPKPVQDVAIYSVIHQPRRLRLPALLIPAGAGPEEMAACLFDGEMNQRYFHKVARRCYYPATHKMLELVQAGGFKITIGFSMSFIEQARRWDTELLKLFQSLVAHPNVELAAVEPYHCFLPLWNVPHFALRMQQARQELGELFGKVPQVADTTEMLMSDTIYHALNQAGFKGAFFDGRPWVLEWRQPTYLYGYRNQPLRLLARHYQLSDDVGYRFSNRGWSGWPLMADTYSGWIAAAQGDLVLLGWDYETFGEHHNKETGIFEFLDRFAQAVPERGLQFYTASEIIDRHGGETYDLPLPGFHSTWAGSGGMDFFLGNPAQFAIFQLMMAAYNKALLTGDPALIDLSLWLAQSDNLHLIQWYGRQGSEAEVSAYFTPREWWQLGPERIIQEMQKVYHNFLTALDGALEGVPALPDNMPSLLEYIKK